MANSSDSLDRPVSNFQLGNHRICSFKDRPGRGNHRGIDGFIGGFRHGDQIIASDTVDQDQRDPAWRTLHTLKVIDIDAFLNQAPSGVGPERIGAVSTEKRDRSTRSGSRNSLVRALAASKHLKFPTEYCFTRFW